jgi:very-short-patch-repair endonuclease
MKRSRNSSSGSDRVWASRDRTIVPPNRLRAHAMRASPTIAERRLWWHLRHRLAIDGTHFRRQVHLGRYIVDFVSHDARLIIEVDGGQHDAQSRRDVERTRASLSRRAIACCGSGITKCSEISTAFWS